ncbi:MAG: FkbM family methyltransferase [Pseudomonadales bacterium]|jgi:FkbM family methyltransferase|nr:FkbM family methyltransferase [Pseudomonadales bacterium]MDP6471882.1 FkbM family methyltransferase [Pseudomonadales bacterium]MDP6826848.1 FkbM family methyltransferase [Pseudomonadales bacterium]|tara:strand:- start:732 stop:1460 length:729 start_codon:yes stop_codon:yes gene_type:complete
MEQVKSYLRPVRNWLQDLTKPRVERLNKKYDRDTVCIIASLPNDAVCIDIGASSGSILKEMIHLVPRGRFFAFEARPEAAQRLQEHFPEVETHAVALSNEVGTATFHVVEENLGYSGLRRQDYPGGSTVREITLPVDLLDNIIPHDLDITFIKLDVEGAEYNVLQGASEICRRSRPLIVFEYGLAGRDNYSTTPAMIFNLLASLGLKVSLLSAWLKGKHAMDLQTFERACHKHYYFAAHPPR